MFSGILFTMTLRLMFIKTWKASNDTWLEKVTLFKGWSPQMCICSMDLESHLEPATGQVSYSLANARSLCLAEWHSVWPSVFSLIIKGTETSDESIDLRANGSRIHSYTLAPGRHRQGNSTLVSSG